MNLATRTLTATLLLATLAGTAASAADGGRRDTANVSKRTDTSTPQRERNDAATPRSHGLLKVILSYCASKKDESLSDCVARWDRY